MRNRIWISGLMLLSTCGCTGLNNTEQGALTGAGIGGLFGALVGGRHALPAAAVGAVGGGLIGGAIGADKDRQDQRRTAVAVATANQAARNQMSLPDIVQLAQRGTPDDIIIRQMDATGSVFSLTIQDINYLQDQNVSSRVISAMQARRTRTVIVQPRQPDVIYVSPPPPAVFVEPGVSVGIRGRF
jgi:Glycine zipper